MKQAAKIRPAWIHRHHIAYSSAGGNRYTGATPNSRGTTWGCLSLEIRRQIALLPGCRAAQRNSSTRILLLILSIQLPDHVV